MTLNTILNTVRGILGGVRKLGVRRQRARMSANTVPAMLETRILLDGTPTDPTGTPTPTTYTYSTTTTTPYNNPTTTATPTPTPASAPGSQAPPAEVFSAKEIAFANRFRAFMDANPNATSEEALTWAITEYAAAEGLSADVQAFLTAQLANTPIQPFSAAAPAPAAPPVPIPVPQPNSDIPGMPANAPQDLREGYFGTTTGTIITRIYTVKTAYQWDGQPGVSINDGDSEQFAFKWLIHETKVTNLENVYKYVTKSVYDQAVLDLQANQAQAVIQAAAVAEANRKASIAERISNALTTVANLQALTSAVLFLAAAGTMGAAGTLAGLTAAAAAESYLMAHLFGSIGRYFRSEEASAKTALDGIEKQIIKLVAGVDSGAFLPWVVDAKALVDRSPEVVLLNWHDTGVREYWSLSNVMGSGPGPYYLDGGMFGEQTHSLNRSVSGLDGFDLFLDQLVEDIRVHVVE